MTSGWPADAPGVLTLPSGRRVRGRSLRRPVGEPPTFAVHLRWRALEPSPPWAVRTVQWPDFLLPLDPADARDALREAWERAAAERVEVACPGGVGRTGTGLAVLAMHDGLSPEDAVAFVRAHHHPRAVETPWQRRWLRSAT